MVAKEVSSLDGRWKRGTVSSLWRQGEKKPVYCPITQNHARRHPRSDERRTVKCSSSLGRKKGNLGPVLQVLTKKSFVNRVEKEGGGLFDAKEVLIQLRERVKIATTPGIHQPILFLKKKGKKMSPQHRKGKREKASLRWQRGSQQLRPGSVFPGPSREKISFYHRKRES